MFFDEDYEPEMVLNDRIERLEEDLEIGERILNPTSLPERWAYFSYLKGLEEGLNDMYSVNFGYTMSSFIAGMGVDAGTDIYFKIEMDEAIFDLYEDIRKQYENGEELVKQFFNTVLEWYKSEDGACKYEKAVFQHNIRVGNATKEWFLSQGQSSKRTIVQLMKKEIKCPTLIDKGKEENITFKFTYSEEELWNKVDEDNDVDKLNLMLR